MSSGAPLNFGLPGRVIIDYLSGSADSRFLKHPAFTFVAEGGWVVEDCTPREDEWALENLGDKI